jgi:hypothetical protein
LIGSDGSLLFCENQAPGLALRATRRHLVNPLAGECRAGDIARRILRILHTSNCQDHEAWRRIIVRLAGMVPGFIIPRTRKWKTRRMAGFLFGKNRRGAVEAAVACFSAKTRRQGSFVDCVDNCPTGLPALRAENSALDRVGAVPIGRHYIRACPVVKSLACW